MLDNLVWAENTKRKHQEKRSSVVIAWISPNPFGSRAQEGSSAQQMQSEGLAQLDAAETFGAPLHTMCEAGGLIKNSGCTLVPWAVPLSFAVL